MTDAGAVRELCVLVLQYNSTDLTLQLLDSLVSAESSHLHRYRVVVLDNASEDAGDGEIARRFPFVEFRAFDRNLGFAAAHNRALEGVHEPWVLLLNNDCILRNDAIHLTHATAVSAGADFATCRLLHPDGSDQINFSTAPTPLRRILLNVTGVNRLVIEPLRRRAPLCRVGYMNGAFLLLRRAAIPPPALFDERYFMYTEDLDLMIRLHRAGRTGLRVRDARAVHLGGGSAVRAWGDAERLAQKERQALECMSRYYPGWQVALWSALTGLRRHFRR